LLAFCFSSRRRHTRLVSDWSSDVCSSDLKSTVTCFPSPESYTPKHLAEKILTSKSALEGERKQVTVLFADLKGSMELLANRDPRSEERRVGKECRSRWEADH